jgi:phosphoribosylaminoimidazole-succinocarboxamide synthase
MIDDQLILVDEIFTPDSSRFWDLSEYSPGRAQSSFDKQFVRDYLETLDWDKTPPAPPLPDDIIERTSAKYQEAYHRLTGRQWPDSDVRAS